VRNSASIVDAALRAFMISSASCFPWGQGQRGPTLDDCEEEVQTDEASPELGGLDRDIPERFLQVPVLGPDRVDRSGRHPLLKASPRRDQVESGSVGGSEGRAGSVARSSSGTGGFQRVSRL
jgi:hypothetical protein